MKKLIVLLLIFISFTVYAESAVTKEEAAKRLNKLQIISGYGNGDLGLERNITRAEMTTLLIRVMNSKGELKTTDAVSFSDVAQSHWAFANINAAYTNKVVSGYPDGTFKPSNNLNYGEVVTLLVRLTGKTDNLEGTWPDNYIKRAKELKIIPETENVEDKKKTVNRGDVSYYLWNALLVEM